MTYHNLPILLKFLFYNEEPPYLHPSGFILRPDGTIVLLVQSSGAIGRLTASDTIGLIKYYQRT